LFEFKSEISKEKSIKMIIKKIRQEKRDSKIRRMSRWQKVDLVFLFSFSFLFYFQFIFNFSIFRTLGLGSEVIGHTVTSVTSDGVVTTLITELKRRK